MGRTYDSSKEQIYKIYKNLFNSDIQYGKKKDILRALFIGEKWTWKVVKISKNVVLECRRFLNCEIIKNGRILLKQYTDGSMRGTIFINDGTNPGKTLGNFVGYRK